MTVLHIITALLGTLLEYLDRTTCQEFVKNVVWNGYGRMRRLISISHVVNPEMSFGLHKINR